MSEHEPENLPSDDELDLEGPNEGAAGDNPELDDEELESLEDDDGYPAEENDEY
jgi:hypothetical protein